MELGDNLDFVKNQALNMRLQNLSTTYPSGSGTSGVIYFNSTNNLAYYLNNSGVEVPFGGVQNGYSSFNDGTNTQNASGNDAFRFRSANTAISTVVGTDGTNGKNLLITFTPANVTHSSLGGLTSGDAGHTQFALLAGRNTGQTLYGGVTSGASLRLSGTSYASANGKVYFGSTNTNDYFDDDGDEWHLSDVTVEYLQTNDLQATGSTTLGVVSAGATTVATLSASGQITSTLANGTAPFVVASATQVANLNASLLAGRAWSDTATTNAIVSVGAGGKVAAGYISGVLAITDLTTPQTGTGNVVLATSPTITSPTFSPTSNISANANSGRISNVLDPVNPQDAATKAYVDAAQMGLDVKASVRAVLTSNQALNSGLASADGVSLNYSDRVLLVGQTNAAENGIYIVVPGSLQRATDADANAEVTAGMYTFVEEGTNYADSGWILTTNGAITLGTTALNFVQFTGAGQITAGAGMTKSGNTLNVGANANGTIVVNADDISVSAALQSLHSKVAGGTFGFLAVTSSNTSVQRTLTGTSNRIQITGGTGSSNDPVFDVGTDVVVITGSYSNPSWITALAGSKVSGNISGNAANVTGTVAVANGGTGLTTMLTNGILYATGSGALSQVAPGNSGVLVTNGSGVPSISSTLPAVNGSAVTNLTAGNLTGTVPTARLGTGTADSGAFLRGDQTWSNTLTNGFRMSGGLAMFGNSAGTAMSTVTAVDETGTPPSGAVTRGMTVVQNGNDQYSALFNFYKSSGSFASPAAVAQNNYAAVTSYNVHDGTAYRVVASAGLRTTGVSATNNIPTELFWAISTNHDYDPYTNNTVRMKLNTTGLTVLGTINATSITGTVNVSNISGQVPVANGGTGAATKAAARADTGLADTGKRLTQTSEHLIGNGSLTTIDVVHNLNTTKISWNITKASDGTQIMTTGRAYDANTLRLTFSVAPANNSLNVIVQG